VTDEDVVDALVSTLPFCSMSMSVAPLGPTVPPLTSVALAPVKVTVPARRHPSVVPI
jgi:hypothetical protein